MIHQQRALVTGASEGIGRVFAKRLAAAGYSVTAVARTEAKLKELIAELGVGTHTYLIADLTTSAGIEQIATELAENHYNLLVNNAGFGSFGAIADTPLATFQEMIQLNCTAVVTLSQAFVTRAERGDALINVSSTLGFLPRPYHGVYAATKSFVTTFSETLWFEQQPHGVYVMALCPGPVATNFAANAGYGGQQQSAIMVQTPEAVVQIAMTALQDRSKPTVLSQRPMLKVLSLIFTRLLPRKTLVRLMGRTVHVPATPPSSTSS